MSDREPGSALPVRPRRRSATAVTIPAVLNPRSSKIRDRHLDRLAVVYVRQSSPQQVLDHKESRERQYALAGHALAMGWAEERVLIIDEDQGQSGKTAEHRLGYQRLMAEITMDHIGLVLGLEMSRLSRSSKDWHHLLEVCALFGTLLADQDGVYDPNDSNDRLLLGLKGTMSEFELCTMRNRLDRGRINKAERGELFPNVPLGYVKLTPGAVAMDPDEQARSVVQLVFDKFDELGTLWSLFHYLVRNDIRLGIRPQHGPRRGQLEWRRPSLPTLRDVLRNPIYAGAYAYGRRPCDPRRKTAGSGRPVQRWVPMAAWKVLIRDRVPAYIAWERYLAIQERLRRNRSRPDAPGAPRDGAALLTGLLVCGTCGRRLSVSYQAKTRARYSCVRHLHEAREQVCYGLKAASIDDLVARQVFLALEPAALELSLKAVEGIQQERGRLHRHREQQLERARYESVRAERQYQAVEPENRLVARTLEQRWEETLRDQRQLEDEYDRFLRAQPAQLSEAERALVLSLSGDIPALWDSPGTTAPDRKEIVRLLVERVVVHVRNDSEYVDATIHWRGGFTSRHEVVRPVRIYKQLRDHDRLLDRITRWRREGRTAVQIAEGLNGEGFRTPRGRGDYTTELVRRLLSRYGLTGEESRAGQLGPNEWWLPGLAGELQMSVTKLRDWVVKGWALARKTPGQGPWVIWADAGERKRLSKLNARSKRGVVTHPAALTSPKRRASN
jgi:DNA invertase Pin-like site-specific DNA recombinase